MRRAATPSLPHRAQRGIVLVFALITLVIMLIGAVAISRSMNSSQFGIGNIGFKRDMTNQAERAVQAALNAVNTGGVLNNLTTRDSNVPAANYSAVLLPSNPQGIPLALLGSDTAFSAVGSTANDLTPDPANQITIRYIVDRMATSTGACTPATCTMLNDTVYGGASTELISAQNNSSAANSTNPSAVTPQAIYRVSVRVMGPRKTLSFYQSTFTAN